MDPAGVLGRRPRGSPPPARGRVAPAQQGNPAAPVELRTQDPRDVAQFLLRNRRRMYTAVLGDLQPADDPRRMPGSISGFDRVDFRIVNETVAGLLERSPVNVDELTPDELYLAYTARRYYQGRYAAGLELNIRISGIDPDDAKAALFQEGDVERLRLASRDPVYAGLGELADDIPTVLDAIAISTVHNFALGAYARGGVSPRDDVLSSFVNTVVGFLRVYVGLGGE